MGQKDPGGFYEDHKLKQQAECIDFILRNIINGKVEIYLLLKMIKVHSECVDKADHRSASELCHFLYTPESSENFFPIT